MLYYNYLGTYALCGAAGLSIRLSLQRPRPPRPRGALAAAHISGRAPGQRGVGLVLEVDEGAGAVIPHLAAPFHIVYPYERRHFTV